MNMMMENTIAIILIGMITIVSSILSKRYHKKIIHLCQKENELNNRLETLEIIVKQLETNIMTFSLDLHANEKKTQNDMIEFNDRVNDINRQLDTTVNSHNCLNSKLKTIDIVLKTVGMYQLAKDMQREREKCKHIDDNKNNDIISAIVNVDNYGL